MSEGVRFKKAWGEKETAKALLVRHDDFEGGKLWIPKSVIHDDSEVYNATDHADGDLVLEEWWASKEGLS